MPRIREFFTFVFITLDKLSDRVKEERVRKELAKGFKGMGTIFVAIFCVSFVGMWIKLPDFTTFDHGFDLFTILKNEELFQNLLGITVFEFTILAIPLALIYCLALIAVLACTQEIKTKTSKES